MNVKLLKITTCQSGSVKLQQDIGMMRNFGFRNMSCFKAIGPSE